MRPPQDERGALLGSLTFGGLGGSLGVGSVGVEVGGSVGVGSMGVEVGGSVGGVIRMTDKRSESAMRWELEVLV